MISAAEFFDTPREWSTLKYKILQKYLSEYFPKVNQAYGTGAVVADLFAGRGRFDDGSEGSPLICAKYAKQYYDRLGYKNTIVLAEENEEERARLQENVQEYINSGIVKIIPGDAEDAGKQLLNSIPGGVPLLIFLDPFGIKGLSMELLTQIFNRSKKDSTEILVNYNHRALPRLAGICQHRDSPDPTLRKQANSTLTTVNEVFGGDWWLNDMLAEGTDEDQKNQTVMRRYKSFYEDHFKWVVLAPVLTNPFSTVPKYYLIFASRSQVAFELMNDVFRQGKHEMMVDAMRDQNLGTLFEGMDPSGMLPRQMEPDLNSLAALVLSVVKEYVGEQMRYLRGPGDVMIQRPIIRGRLIPAHFGDYSCSEYNSSIGTLLKQGMLISENSRSRISDAVQFKLARFE